MQSVSVRPTFNLPSELSTSVVVGKINAEVAACPERLKGQFKGRHCMISINESHRHFWSPWLNVEVSDNESGCEIFGRFSPHPTIWTGFMFSYLAIAVLGFFAIIIGVAQQLAGEFASGYLLLPVLLLSALGLWLTSQVGQRLASAEMKELKTMIEGCAVNSSLS